MRLKKNLNIILCTLMSGALSAGLTACSFASPAASASQKSTESSITTADIINAVELPAQYFISYEIESTDGVVTVLSRGVDAGGNIYFSDGGDAVLYMVDDGRYTRCNIGEMGDLQKYTAEIYTDSYVKEATAPFTDFAEKSRMKFSGAARQTEDLKIAGRDCKTYEIDVTFANFTQIYQFAIDKETGVCMSWQSTKTISGHQTDSDEMNFRCTFFAVENVTFPVKSF